jgi:hypothetical protein
MGCAPAIALPPNEVPGLAGGVGADGSVGVAGGAGDAVEIPVAHPVRATQHTIPATSKAKEQDKLRDMGFTGGKDSKRVWPLLATVGSGEFVEIDRGQEGAKGSRHLLASIICRQRIVVDLST